jgi:hypothetical protein
VHSLVAAALEPDRVLSEVVGGRGSHVMYKSCGAAGCIIGSLYSQGGEAGSEGVTGEFLKRGEGA